ncbi:hypothetical protein [Naasia sp. SYSU D00057]|uniref:hypothetical protein n=1 Tax=Naasia sp. SYSU D00057 TaxID=2817380 RepID=UPI001B308FA3|nr:hypothetical protein [Naasia sp. SYSU D00057]
MSFRSPVGPQPSSVYWRRRILVLLGLIAVIAAVVLVIVRPGANAAPADPSPSPSPAAEESAPAATPAPDEATEDPAASGAVAPCTAGQVQVIAVTDKTTYAEGESPQLSWTISNTGAAPCSLNVGTNAQVFTITSGSDTVWTSTDCQAEGQDVEYTLETAASGAEPTPVSPLQWDRERSTPDTCDGNRPQVTGGGASYHLTVSVGGFESADSAQFILN